MKSIAYSLNVFIVAMQSKIDNEVQFSQAMNPLKNVAKVSSMDNTSDLKDVFTKIISLRNYGTMVTWTMTLSDIFQVGQKYQGRCKFIVCTHKEYMSLLIHLI